MDEEVPPPSGLVIVAGFALAFAGITLVASGAQMIVLFDWYAVWISALVYLEILLGVAAVYTGFSFTRAVGWTADTGFVLAVSTAGFELLRVIAMYFVGLLTAVSVFAMLLALGAALFIALTRNEVIRIHQARARLLASLREPGP